MSLTPQTDPEANSEEMTSTSLRLTPLENVVGEIMDAAEEESSPQPFLRRTLSIIGKGLRMVYAELEVTHSATVIRESYADETVDPDFWCPTVQTLLTDTLVEPRPHARLFRGRSDNVKITLLSTPMRTRERMSGALAAVAPCTGREQAEELIDRLTALTTLACELLDGLGKTEAEPAELSNDGASSVKRVANFTSETELAFAITNRLRSREGCEMVALAAVHGHVVKMLSVSGQDEFVAKSPGIRAMLMAMEECADLAKYTVHQAGPSIDHEDLVFGPPLHREWHVTAGNTPVASIPLLLEGKCVAVLCVRRQPGAGFTVPDLDEYRELVEPYAAGLEMVRRANRRLIPHAVHSCKESIKSLFSPGAWTRKVVLAASIAVTGWFFFGNAAYELTVPCSISPAEKTTIAAPFDSVLRASNFMPGATVAKGDILAEFDTATLQLELSRLQSEYDILEVEESRALAEDSPADVSLTRANQRGIQASIDLVNSKLSYSSIRAPRAGTLLTGDLRDRIGGSISKGEVLFEIASEDAWNLELRVPESEVVQIEPGQAGEFASLSRPDITHNLTVLSLNPTAEQKGGKNVFIAEASAEIQEEWMRSGMEGMAKIEVGTRSPCWLALHGAVDYMRLQFWL